MTSFGAPEVALLNRNRFCRQRVPGFMAAGGWILPVSSSVVAARARRLANQLWDTVGDGDPVADTPVSGSSSLIALDELPVVFDASDDYHRCPLHSWVSRRSIGVKIKGCFQASWICPSREWVVLHRVTVASFLRPRSETPFSHSSHCGMVWFRSSWSSWTNKMEEWRGRKPHAPPPTRIDLSFHQFLYLPLTFQNIYIQNVCPSKKVVDFLQLFLVIRFSTFS